MDAKKNWWWNSGAATNAYLTAYLARLTALGYTAPSAATLAAMNTFLNTNSGTLPILDNLYIIALNNTGLASAANVNLITPASFLMTRSGAVSQLVSGLQGDAVSAYADTNYNPATQGVNYTLNAATRFMYVHTVGAGSALDSSNNGVTAFNSVIPTSSAGQRINASFNNLVGGAVDLSGTGYVAITRLDATNVELYKNLTKFTRTQTSTSINSFTQQLCKQGSTFSSHVFALYGMGGIMTEAQHNTMRNSFVTYLTALGL